MISPKLFSASTRAQNLSQKQEHIFDLIVIGGGITGAAITLAAQMNGYQTCLIEKGDFASGTSSKSTKLIHGGLRYLEQFELKLVYEALQARGDLLKTAMHLVKPERILFPLFKKDKPSSFELRAGLTLYDLLAFFKNIAPHQMLSREATLTEEPHLNREGLTGAGLFYDCATDDVRLTLATIRTAYQLGAVVFNYVEAQSIAFDEANQVTTLSCMDHVGRKACRLKAHCTVAALGPWMNKVSSWSNEVSPAFVRPSKGTHIAFDHSQLPLKNTLAMVNRRDGRLMFVRPWVDGLVFAGTTDTVYDGPLDEVHCTLNEAQYILDALVQKFPRFHSDLQMVRSAWAGLRPLIASQESSTYQSSREHAIWQLSPRHFAIAGGKLTTHHVMAEEVIKKLRSVYTPSAFTGIIALRKQPLLGSRDKLSVLKDVEAQLIKPEIAEILYHRYGSEITALAELIQEDPPLGQHIHPELSYLRAEVVFSVRHECVTSLSDFMLRRSNLAFTAQGQTLPCIYAVARLMESLLGWDKETFSEEVENYNVAIQVMLPFRKPDDYKQVKI